MKKVEESEKNCLSKFQKDLTQGSVAKHLVLFSLPFLASNFLQALYNMADMFFVGRFNGAVGASAVGVGGQVTILMINLIAGLAVGGTVLIAQLVGAGKQDALRKTIGTIFTLYGVAALVMTVVMLIANPHILKLLSDELAYDETLKYVQVCTVGLFFIFGYNAVSAILRGMGDSKHPLLFVGIAAVLNIVLDYVACGPLDMGAAGAAWATVISQGVSFVMSVIFLRKKNFVFDFRLKSFRIDRATAKSLVTIGLPTSIGTTAVSLSFMVLTGVANSIAGMIGTTALSVAGKVNSVAILPTFAMQSAVASMAGQNLGASKPKRAFSTTITGIGIAIAITVVMFVLVQTFAQPIVRFFLGDESAGLDPEVALACVDQSVVYIRSISYDYLFVAFVFNITGLAMAAGHTKFSLVVGLISSLVVRVPAAWILGKVLQMGIMGMGFAAPIATGVSMLIDIVYLASGKWKKTKINVETYHANTAERSRKA
ncbi:MAG: MATE family efflux transporter [Oscillospiraceae bacterium]|jgi:putative MATE family efflux protein|nr:MATE family efflux transporter [Oscillospiraceae bacterium]